MHICVVGDGAAGLMAANLFAVKNYVSKVTLIGSSKIPSIGVGESTTLIFENLHRSFDANFASFVTESDACVKTGVMYSNWSKNEFLHFFKMPHIYEMHGVDFLEYSNSLGNKDPDVFIHELLANRLYKDVKEHKIPIRTPNCFYGLGWHFDAGKYIAYLKKLFQRNPNKTEFIDDTVVDCKFKKDDTIDFITLESNRKIEADYYVISTGKTQQSSEIFKIKYHDLSDVLLTDKALFFPKKYIDRKKEMHPYTIAKTMKNGWRWITPTWSRIGTGYVFSSNHITIEQAIEEFQDDIGDKNVIPNVVDFHPRYSTKTFNANYMTLGMCNGFLEPLDAPGLTISCALTILLDEFLSKNDYFNQINRLNNITKELYQGWAAFILTQYKTSHRSDTQFWDDHKNVKFDYLDKMLDNLNNDAIIENDSMRELIKKDLVVMLQNTISSKDIQWKTTTKSLPFKFDDYSYTSVNHYEFLENLHNNI